MVIRLLCMLFLAGWLWHPADGVAQPSDAALNRLTQAFQEADASMLMGLAAPTIEVALFGDARQYSRPQATLLMRSFFKDYPSVSFDVDDFTKTGRGWFIQASYSTRGWEGDSVRLLRVYLRLRQNDSDWRIREILIEDARE